MSAIPSKCEDCKLGRLHWREGVCRSICGHHERDRIPGHLVVDPKAEPPAECPLRHGAAASGLPRDLRPMLTTHPASAAYRVEGGYASQTWSHGETVAMARALVELDNDRRALAIPDFETAVRMVAAHIHGQGKFYIEIAVDPKTKEVGWTFEPTERDEGQTN